MNYTYKVSEIIESEILLGIRSRGGFDNTNLDTTLTGLEFHSFTLKELNLPESSILLKSILQIESEIGLKGWVANGIESQVYKGFSLTYNSEFNNQETSIFHQTWGSKDLKQSFSRKFGIGKHNVNETKNSYYDSYAFRKIHPLIKNNLGYLFEKFRFSLVRSRVAYYYGNRTLPNYAGTWHVDEYPCEVFRINIPIQTSEEHVIDIKGKDEFNNEYTLENFHLETEKLYIWNTRIPHRIRINKRSITKKPRISIVLGFSPWYDYIEEDDVFVRNEFWGIPIVELVNSKAFIR
jgi:hypothetical protein